MGLCKLYVLKRNGAFETVSEKKQIEPGSGVYYLRFTWNGKRTRRSVESDNLSHALTVKHNLEQELLGKPIQIGNLNHARILDTIPESNPETKPTLADLRLKFLAAKRCQRKRDGSLLDKETVSAHSQHSEEFLRIAGENGHRYPEQIDGDDLRQYIDWLYGEDYAPDSVNNRYTNIATFLKFCVVDHKALLPIDERPQKSDPEPVAYEKEEVAAFLDACDEKRDRLFFRFMLGSGAREREATTLEWSDIDFKGSRVRFACKDGFRTKTGKNRWVPLDQPLLRALEDWEKDNPKTKLVFPTEAGKVEHHFLRRCKAIARKCGFDDKRWRLHRWRDTFATWAIGAHPDQLKTVSLWLGHASVEMTTKRYLAKATGKVEQMVINDVFGSVAAFIDEMEESLAAGA